MILGRKIDVSPYPIKEEKKSDPVYCIQDCIGEDGVLLGISNVGFQWKFLAAEIDGIRHGE